MQVPRDSRHKAGVVSLMFAVCLLLFLPGCQGPFAPQDTAGTGTVSLTIETLNMGRAIMPEGYSMSDFVRVMVAFTSDGIPPVEREVTGGAITVDLPTNIGGAARVWAIVVTAYRGPGDGMPAARGTGTVTVTDNSSENIPITLRPIRENVPIDARGTFVWDLDFPTGVDSVEVRVYDEMGGALVFDSTDADDETPLYVGDYFVIFELSHPTYGTLVFGRDLHIYWNLTSRFAFEFLPGDFITIDAVRYSLRNELIGATTFANLGPALAYAGSPAFRIGTDSGVRYLHVGGRQADHYAIDIAVAQLLARGAQDGDILTIRGRVDGVPPSGAQVQLQRMPGHGWIGGTAVSPVLARAYSDFTLTLTLGENVGGANAVGWETLTHIRLQSNAAGATMSFYIYDIIVSPEAPNLGVLPIPPPVPFVIIGAQSDVLQEGEAGSVTFPVTVGNWLASTININPVTIAGLPSGLEAAILVEGITAIGDGGNGTGALTISGTPAASTANAPGVELTLDLDAALARFTLLINAAGSNDAALYSLMVDSVDVVAQAGAPGFGHSLAVATGVTTMPIVATADCPYARIVISRNGTEVANSGAANTATHAVALTEPGLSIISVTVTAQAGNEETYTVSVFRSFPAPELDAFDFQARLGTADPTNNYVGSTIVAGIVSNAGTSVFVREFGTARFIDVDRTANWHRIELLPAGLGLSVGDEIIVHGRVCMNATGVHAGSGSHMWMAPTPADHVSATVPNHAANVPAGGAFTLSFTLVDGTAGLAIRGNQNPPFFIEHIEVRPAGGNGGGLTFEFPGDNVTLAAGAPLPTGFGIHGTTTAVVGDGVITISNRDDTWQGLDIDVNTIGLSADGTYTITMEGVLGLPGDTLVESTQLMLGFADGAIGAWTVTNSNASGHVGHILEERPFNFNAVEFTMSAAASGVLRINIAGDMGIGFTITRLAIEAVGDGPVFSLANVLEGATALPSGFSTHGTIVATVAGGVITLDRSEVPHPGSNWQGLDITVVALGLSADGSYTITLGGVFGLPGETIAQESQIQLGFANNASATWTEDNSNFSGWGATSERPFNFSAVSFEMTAGGGVLRIQQCNAAGSSGSFVIDTLVIERD